MPNHDHVISCDVSIMAVACNRAVSVCPVTFAAGVRGTAGRPFGWLCH
jgi:hypothetical protein